MTQYVSKAKDLLVRAINGVGEVFDALAGLAPEPWNQVLGFILTAGGTFGLFHLHDPGAVVTAFTAFIFALAAIGKTGEGLIAAIKK